jgi:uracil phosphoribosyltransferase
VDLVHRIADPVTVAYANLVRQRETPRDDLRRALAVLGGEVGKRIVEAFCLVDDDFRTPMDVPVRGPIPRIPLSVVLTPTEDFDHFAAGLHGVLLNCELGWMDFEGRRGLDALNAPVRQMSLPDLHGQRVELLVIGKALLASGCTAVSLARNAFARYMPTRLVVATVFYSMPGLALLQQELPNAHVFVVGDPDVLNDDGLLLPGVGMLAQRTGDDRG